MNAREHRAEAERLLEAAKADVRTADPSVREAWTATLDRAAVALRAADLHARLAALPESTEEPRPAPDVSWLERTQR